MAWTSKEEEALTIVGEHMKVMDDERKYELKELYAPLIFPSPQGNAWSNIKWISIWGVTIVTMWDEEHLLKNIQYCMLLEHMGIGPKKYCILTNWMPHFTQKLMLLINYLPYKKMCFYPRCEMLGEPFLHKPWQAVGEAICDRKVTVKNPLFRTTYFTQQFVVFLRTGVYGIAYWF